MAKELKNIDVNIQKFFKNEYVSWILRIILILYAAIVAPSIDRKVSSIFDNVLVRLIIACIIVFLSFHDTTLAILLSIAFVVSIQTLNKHKVNTLSTIKEKFSNRDSIETATCNKSDDFYKDTDDSLNMPEEEQDNNFLELDNDNQGQDTNNVDGTDDDETQGDASVIDKDLQGKAIDENFINYNNLNTGNSCWSCNNNINSDQISNNNINNTNNKKNTNNTNNFELSEDSQNENNNLNVHEEQDYIDENHPWYQRTTTKRNFNMTNPILNNNQNNDNQYNTNNQQISQMSCSSACKGNTFTAQHQLYNAGNNVVNSNQNNANSSYCPDFNTQGIHEPHGYDTSLNQHPLN
jgi:hypothetical protein